MNSFFFDASALAKRSSHEAGSSLIDHLFSNVSHTRLSCLMLGAAEVVSVLVRRRNGGLLPAAACAQGVLNLQAEVVDAEEFQSMPAGNDLISAALPFIDRHALNATDSIVLRLALDLAAQVRADGLDLVLVASDQRLLRAAQAEGLTSFNPETQKETELDSLLTV